MLAWASAFSSTCARHMHEVHMSSTNVTRMAGECFPVPVPAQLLLYRRNKDPMACGPRPCTTDRTACTVVDPPLFWCLGSLDITLNDVSRNSISILKYRMYYGLYHYIILNVDTVGGHRRTLAGATRPAPSLPSPTTPHTRYWAAVGPQFNARELPEVPRPRCFQCIHIDKCRVRSRLPPADARVPLEPASPYQIQIRHQHGKHDSAGYRRQVHRGRRTGGADRKARVAPGWIVQAGPGRDASRGAEGLTGRHPACALDCLHLAWISDATLAQTRHTFE